MKNLLLYISLTILVKYSKAQTVGLCVNDTGNLAGYVLFAPISSDTTYLIDKCGYLVHTWASKQHPALYASLSTDGSLLRPGANHNKVFNSDGNGGLINKYDWNGNLIWTYTLSSDTDCQHHDIIELPNGNILVHAWELKTLTQALAAGRNPAYLDTVSLWSEKLIEIQPTGSSGGNIVWEWHAWDHLIQDYDATKANYGVVAQHPELLNLNYTGSAFNLANVSDWLHCNAIDYNASFDQIILNSHNLSEVWVIDHSTSTAQAASHSGGKYGKGGDFLYRWGNPAAYDAGTSANQVLYGDHNPHWIDSGLNGAGNIMVFNNGLGRPTGGNYSQVEIFAPPVNSSGAYSYTAGQSYLPDSSYWTYESTPSTNFYSQNISGAQSLSNGDIMVCEGDSGIFFEINAAKKIVWRYINPVSLTGRATQGTKPLTNSVFRCMLYEPSYLGFTGQTLTSGRPIEVSPLPYSCKMVVTGINELNSVSNTTIKVVNPITSELLIETSQDLLNSSIELMDITGRSVAKFSNVHLIGNSQVSLVIDKSLSQGIYILAIKSSQQNFTLKLIH